MSIEVAKLPTAAPNPDIVSMLKKFLEAAESGSLRSVVLVGVKHGSLVCTGFIAGEASVFETLGAIEHVKRRFMETQIEGGYE